MKTNSLSLERAFCLLLQSRRRSQNETLKSITAQPLKDSKISIYPNLPSIMYFLESPRSVSVLNHCSRIRGKEKKQNILVNNVLAKELKTTKTRVRSCSNKYYSDDRKRWISLFSFPTSAYHLWKNLLFE